MQESSVPKLLSLVCDCLGQDTLHMLTFTEHDLNFRPNVLSKPPLFCPFFGGGGSLYDEGGESAGGMVLL